MKRICSTLLTIILAATFSASAQGEKVPLSIPGVHADPKPIAIAKPNAKAAGWSVFGPAQEFQGSPLPHIGRNGLFDVRSSEENLIAILPNGEDSFSARIKTIMKARTSVRIQALTFKGDESGLYIAEILKYKKAQGFDVRVIVDAFSNLDPQTKRMYFALQQHGIDVEGYETFGLEWLNEIPIHEVHTLEASLDLNKRFHEKMWIIDGETDHGIAILGGLNIGNEYFRVDPSNPSRYWRDQDIIVRGAIVKDMATAFDRNHKYAQKIKEGRGIANTNRYWGMTRGLLDEFGKIKMDHKTEPRLEKRVAHMAEQLPELKFEPARARFFQSRPRFEESYITQAYLKLIRDAKEEVLVANAYFIPSAKFIAAIKDAARRCVRVIVLTNSPETNDLPDLTIVGRDYYEEILDVNREPVVRNCPCENPGIQIWEWQGRRVGEEDRSQGTIHAKYAVFDRVVSLVGSHNLDPRSEKLNSETAIIYESGPLSKRLARLFYANDLAFSKRISTEEAKAFRKPSEVLHWLRKKFAGLFEEYF
jgi:putative cardiolipin synthase